ncbi:MAG TPA: helix-turn-helix transcriptional regulator [Sphingomicrobium sp.]|jgi:DNA-binding PadR family transcriptional regulator|nr:helix-turn-helix transcriptional regulator [Sphingomicrobium sp.]
MPGRRPLTDSEGAILTLVLRQQPITAYQIGKAFEASPVHTLNTSKGKLYPLIYRLHDRGLLSGEAVEGDKRGTQLFSCTASGKQALRRWVLTIRPEHELLHDPLRKKIQGFELLSREEQMNWLAEARDRLGRKLEDIERWPTDVEGPYGELVHESAKVALRGRIAWLDAARERIASAPD